MDIKVLIVEDEILVAEDLSDLMKDYGFRVTGIAVSGEECIKLVEKESPDIIIMDINLQGSLSGIDTANLLHQNKRIPLIFLTANSDHATVKKAIPLMPDAFITKPFNKGDLVIAMELACQKHNSQLLDKGEDYNNVMTQAIFLKENNTYKRVDIPSILYIEAKGSYSEVVTTNKSYILSYNLSHFSEQVKHPVFKRVHRSFLVNVNRVDGISNNNLIINKHYIPISKNHQKEVLSLFVKL